MESLYTAFSAVGPMLVYMITGWLIRKTNICTVETFKAWNQLIFRIFIPLSLFTSICEVDLGALVRPGFFIFIEILVISQCVLSWIVLKRVVADKKDHATLVQGIARSNYVLFGMALAANLCDAEGVVLVAALSAMVVPTINIESVVLFEMIRSGKLKPGQLLLRILQNPIVSAGLIGIMFSLLHIRIPSLLLDSLKKLGSTATPIGLMILGGLLSFESMRRHRHLLCIAAVGRLIIFPVIALLLGLLLGCRGNELVAIIAVFGAPTAVASTPTAQVLGGNVDLAAEIVAVTSTGCLATIFLMVLLLSRAGFL